MAHAIKYFFICLCSLYLIPKLAIVKVTKAKLAASLILSFVIVAGIYLLDFVISPIRMLFLVFSLTAYAATVFKIDFNLSVVASVVSAGVGFCLYSLATVLIIPLALLTGPYFNYSVIYTAISAAGAGIIQLLIAFLLFRIRRLRKAMPLFIEKSSGDIGVFICVSALLMCLFFNKEANSKLPLIILIFAVVISAFALFFWWRRRVTRKYLEQLRARETELLKAEIKEQSDEIEYLKANNEELSGIIHKDNKIIPALELAVRSLLEESAANGNNGARGLLLQITELSKERGGIITKYEKSGRVLPSTGVPSTDAVIRYMLQKSAEYGAQFDFSLSASVKRLTAERISENDLNTILANIIENAFIAVKNCERRQVLLSILVEERHYKIDLYDSAPPFETRVLLNLGKRRYTTRKRDGGSGIGLYNTYSLLQKHGATLVIDETPDTANYRKKLSVVFDGRAEYLLKTRDKNKAAACSKRADIKCV